MHSKEDLLRANLYTGIRGGKGVVGATPGNSCWGGLPGFPNPDPISDRKKAIFQTRFQTWPLNAQHFQTWHRQKLCHITWIRPLIKRFFKINFAFAYYSFFLIHLQLKGQIRSYTLVVPLKKHNPFQIQMGKFYTRFQTGGAKTIPLGAAYSYMVDIKE